MLTNIRSSDQFFSHMTQKDCCNALRKHSIFLFGHELIRPALQGVHMAIRPCRQLSMARATSTIDDLLGYV